jgi:hypothetical protein
VVLAVQATEVAACAGDGETGGTRMEMVKGFLLNGVNGQGTGLGINLAHKQAISVATTVTTSRLALSNPTMMGTEQTLYHPIVQPPIFRI